MRSVDARPAYFSQEPVKNYGNKFRKYALPAVAALGMALSKDHQIASADIKTHVKSPTHTEVLRAPEFPIKPSILVNGRKNFPLPSTNEPSRKIEQTKFAISADFHPVSAGTVSEMVKKGNEGIVITYPDGQTLPANNKDGVVSPGNVLETPASLFPPDFILADQGMILQNIADRDGYKMPIITGSVPITDRDITTGYDVFVPGIGAIGSLPNRQEVVAPDVYIESHAVGEEFKLGPTKITVTEFTPDEENPTQAVFQRDSEGRELKMLSAIGFLNRFNVKVQVNGEKIPFVLGFYDKSGTLYGTFNNDGTLKLNNPQEGNVNLTGFSIPSGVDIKSGWLTVHTPYGVEFIRLPEQKTRQDQGN